VIISLPFAPHLADAAVKALVRRLGGDVVLTAEELGDRYQTLAEVDDDGTALRITAVAVGEIQ
jgi:hypothetical protein